MNENDVAKQAEGTETFENQDVKALEEMRIKYETDLAKEKQKYSQLLAYTVSGGGLSSEKKPEPEKSPEEFHHILREFTEDGTKSVILSTHITSDVDRFADYLLFLKEGRQLLYGDIESVRDAYRMVAGERASACPPAGCRWDRGAW